MQTTEPLEQPASALARSLAFGRRSSANTSRQPDQCDGDRDLEDDLNPRMTPPARTHGDNIDCQEQRASQQLRRHEPDAKRERLKHGLKHLRMLCHREFAQLGASMKYSCSTRGSTAGALGGWSADENFSRLAAARRRERPRDGLGRAAGVDALGVDCPSGSSGRRLVHPIPIRVGDDLIRRRRTPLRLILRCMGVADEGRVIPLARAPWSVEPPSPVPPLVNVADLAFANGLGR